MKEQFIKDLKENDTVNSQFSIKYKKPIRKYKNGFTFTVGLSDKSGEIEAKYWGGSNLALVKKIYDTLKISRVITVKGTVGVYNEREQINVEEGSGSFSEAESYHIEDFVNSSEKDVEQLFETFKNEILSIQHSDLKKLAIKLLEDHELMHLFKKSPAAMYYHHNYLGGLLEHTLNMIVLSKPLIKIYRLDEDLLKMGIFLHDLGKVREFEVTTNIKQSEEGLLRGHVSISQEILLKKIDELDEFPKVLEMKLVHMILSHHGKLEQGSLKPPAFPEATALYYLDELDSKVYQYVRAKETSETEDFHIYSKRLGQIYLK